mmetsp:Transcript_708/g.1324  ORF Transcript_708/g.1324 Transcript_708/m.1324 type:complete len:423 (-) Transcript_708:219-1487(-)
MEALGYMVDINYLKLLGYAICFSPLICASLASGWALRHALSDVTSNPGKYVWLWVPCLAALHPAFRLAQLGMQYLSTHHPWRGYQLLFGSVSVVGVASLAIVFKSEQVTLWVWIAYALGTSVLSLYLVILARADDPHEEIRAGVERLQEQSHNLVHTGREVQKHVHGWVLDTMEQIQADSDGRNYLDERIQWVLCGIIWFITAMWLLLYGVFCDSEEMKSDRMTWTEYVHGKDPCVVNYYGYHIVSWSPVCLIVPGYIMFLGFVSYSPSMYDWIQYIMNFACLVYFRFKGGLTAYLLGYFGSCVFLLPVIVARDAELAKYSYKSYTLGVGWTTGISNGLLSLAHDAGYISEPMRWKVQVVGWSLIMSGSVILTACMGNTESYKLTLGETLRYSAFQIAVYTFIYFGICRTMEEAFYDFGGWF